MEKSASAMSAGPSGPAVGAQQPTFEPSAPPCPSAPPSYEEAVGSLGIVNGKSTNSPYPAGQPGIPSTYAPVGMPMAADTGDGPPNPYANQPQPRTEVRVVRYPVPYALGPHSVKMQCPTCLANIKTSTVSHRQPSAHICCIVLCVFGCCLCSCLPYCMSAFLTVHHYCPSCGVCIGTWKG